jgi:amino acid transporter
VLLCLFALYSGKGSGALTMAPLYDASKLHGSSVLAATSICVMAYLGFDAVSTLAEEVKDSDRSVIGKAIMTNLALTSSIFVLTTWVVGNLLVGFPVADPATVIYDVLSAISGREAAVALAWFLVLVVGVPNVLPMQVGVARVLFAMGRDKTLPAVLAKVNRRHGNPYVAMIFSTAVSLSIALVMRNRIDELARFISVGALVGFLFVHMSVLAHFGRHPERRWWAHLAVPLIGMAVIITILSQLNAMALTIGAGWLVAGIVYRLLSRGWKGFVSSENSSSKSSSKTSRESGGNRDASIPTHTN